MFVANNLCEKAKQKCATNLAGAFFAGFSLLSTDLADAPLLPNVPYCPPKLATCVMDSVHDIKSKPWICQRSIKLCELLEKRATALREAGLSIGSVPSKVDPETRRKFQDYVALNRNEVESYFQFNLTDEKHLKVERRCNLAMYQKQLEHAKRMISNRRYKVEYLASLKMSRAEVLMRHQASVNQKQTSDKACPTEASGHKQPTDEIADPYALAAILVVQLWPQPQKGRKLKLDREIEFRHDQCLTELRDHFKCPKDYEVPMDLSDNPEQQADRIIRRELFKSGFFLIEDTFYNDLRDINNTDLSGPIIKWASEEVTVVGEDGRNLRRDRGVGPFQRAKMEETKFQDIIFKLGRPYLYKHQGNCEHLFVISDVRYVPKDDEPSDGAKFPLVTATAFGRKEDSVRCYMCQNRPPHWYTRNNSRLPLDPFLFCENCFMSFNYDDNKRKIGQFQAYLYTSNSGIPDNLMMNK